MYNVKKTSSHSLLRWHFSVKVSMFIGPSPPTSLIVSIPLTKQECCVSEGLKKYWLNE